ncbi:hypothetical protein FSOLCH5_002676 [Fusarium solani]
MVLNPSFEDLDPNSNGMTFSGRPWEVTGSRSVIQQGTNDFKTKDGSMMACVTITGLGGGLTAMQTIQGLDPTKEYYLSYSGRVNVGAAVGPATYYISAAGTGASPPRRQIVNTPHWIDYRTDRFKPLADGSVGVGIPCAGRSTWGTICLDAFSLVRACGDSRG